MVVSVHLSLTKPRPVCWSPPYTRRAKCNTRFKWFILCSCPPYRPFLHTSPYSFSSPNALLIFLDAASLSVAPSNQSGSRIRLPKLPAHISPWEQQQWVPKMQLLIAPRHRFYSPPCCWAVFRTREEETTARQSALFYRLESVVRFLDHLSQ